MVMWKATVVGFSMICSAVSALVLHRTGYLPRPHGVGGAVSSCIGHSGCWYSACAAPTRKTHAHGRVAESKMQDRSLNSPNQIVQFQAADMEILRQVGEMGYATITDWEYYQGRNPLDPSQPLRTVDEAGPAVRLWEARVARGPLRNARMLLKEYLASAREVAEQELRVYTDLVDTFPPSEDFGDAPVATLRGWFKTSVEVESLRFRSNWQERFPRAAVPKAGNIWLAFRWDAFKPMSDLAQSAQSAKRTSTVWDRIKMPKVWGVTLPAPAALSIGLRREVAPPQFARKALYLRHLFKECLCALVFLHERGVVHRSLGAPSVALSSYETGDAGGLQVKLRDFGFASRIARLDDATLKIARSAGAQMPAEIMAYLATEDVYAMGYALLETVFSTLAQQEAVATAAPRVSPLMTQWLQSAAVSEDVSMLGPVGPGQAGSGPRRCPPTDQSALKKLIEDIYDGDMLGSFRDYCLAESDWQEVVLFLDLEDGAGWKLFQSMLSCRHQSRGAGPAVKPLSEMTEAEAGAIPIPDSFLPTFTSDINKLPTARGLLDNRLFQSLQRPWYARTRPAS